MQNRGFSYLLIPVILSACAQAVCADTVFLTNGQSLECLVKEETEQHVKLQVAWQGYMTLQRPIVREIQRAPEPERQELAARWRDEFEAAKQAELDDRAFEEEQYRRNLVKYRGAWITQAEMDAIRREQQEAEQRRLQARQEEEDHDQLERQMRQLSERIESLEEENRLLQGELSGARRELLWRPGIVVIDDDGPQLRRREHRFGRDTQLTHDGDGNFVKIHTDEGRRFIIGQDGKPVDVRRHGRHFAYEDEHGIHHDLEPVRKP